MGTVVKEEKKTIKKSLSKKSRKTKTDRKNPELKT